MEENKADRIGAMANAGGDMRGRGAVGSSVA